MFFNKKEKILGELLDKFSSFISDDDIVNCNEFLVNNEYLLCYDTLVTQIYEYDREITNEDYEYFENVARKLKIDINEYQILKELIRDKDIIPKTVKDNIRKIIENVKDDKLK